MTGFENPGAYDESRKRIKENKEREILIIEEKKESFEKGKEKIRFKKKLDVFELKRRIETGQSLENLKGEIKDALDRGDISVDTYKNALEEIEDVHSGIESRNQSDTTPEYLLDPKMYPLASSGVSKYFESQRIGNNPVIDFAGFTFGLTQGSLFVLWLAGRMVFDALLLPYDIYNFVAKKKI